MSMHTKGEWVAVIDDYGFRIEAHTFLSTGELSTRTEVARREADIKYPPRDCYGEAFKAPCADANAFLLAASKDMYEALQEMVATYETYLETGIPADAEQSKRLHEKMKAALKKAGGE